MRELEARILRAILHWATTPGRDLTREQVMARRAVAGTLALGVCLGGGLIALLGGHG